MVGSEEAELLREEKIRVLASELPGDKRLLFWTQVQKKLKDPDTYAAMNFAFMFGLHHFYVGKWIRGLLAISLFMLGLIILFFVPMVGILLIACVICSAIPALFRSETIVRQYNNELMEQMYRQVLDNAPTTPPNPYGGEKDDG